MVLQVPKVAQRSGAKPDIHWERLPDDFVLPDNPVENLEQPFLAAALTDALGAAQRIQPEMLIAANFALVARVNDQTVVKAPDWVWVAHVQPVPAGTLRKSYTPVLEGDPVGIVMEFLSDDELGELSVRSTYPYGKLYFYEQILAVPSYVVFDPISVTLDVRQLQDDGCYQLQEPDPQGRYWIPAVELFLGVWHGERLGRTTHWLRWWDATGNLLPWSAEQVGQEQQRLVAAQQQVDQERQRAEQAQQRAEQERQRADQLAAKLRELGIDPDAD